MNLPSFRSQMLCALALACALSTTAFPAGSLADEAAILKQRPHSVVVELARAYCLDCHSAEAEPLDLKSLLSAPLADATPAWESVVRKLNSRQMPPLGEARPSEQAYESVLASLTKQLDGIAAARPRVTSTETFRRLTRVEYQNAVRDLLALEIDVAELLPKDESSHGFDNITVGELSPSLLNRYVSAAQKISRAALGRVGKSPAGRTIRVRADITQERHIAGLPIGTRGGTLIRHAFPQDGEYEIRARLARDRNEHVEGLRGRHQVEFLLDRERLAQFELGPPKGPQGHSLADAHLVARIHLTAGPHQLGVTFPARSQSLLETMRQPYASRFNMHRHPRTNPAIFQVTITGPYQPAGPGDTPSRRAVLANSPSDPTEAEASARQNLRRLARLAWRRPVDDAELAPLMRFYQEGAANGGFELGMESALSALLVNPHFLFRLERTPRDADPQSLHSVSDVELASRLSFFLWSSIPDEELLAAAEAGRLSDLDELKVQVSRMLKDSRSDALISNFFGQWLHLRNLDAAHPDMRRFPDFDHNLRDAMRRETELFCASIVRNDRSVTELLSANYTFLNERLAKHYGVPHVYGSHFRRVALEPGSHRGGLLRHGSILTVTSYATRTSPVIRGNWVLTNLLGSPPPPPPANVPALKDNSVAANLSLRARLAQHRRDPNCSGCHNLMDPIGLAMEHYDAIGRWRALDEGVAIDVTGEDSRGIPFSGIRGLEQMLLERPQVFVQTLTEKLMTYALGRGLDHQDAPFVRRVVAQAPADETRFSNLVIGVVSSKPFRYRTAE